MIQLPYVVWTFWREKKIDFPECYFEVQCSFTEEWRSMYTSQSSVLWIERKDAGLMWEKRL